GLFTPDGLTVDAVTFGPQQNNVSQGRYPDGNFAGVLHFMTTPTPQAANVVPVNHSAPVLPNVGNRSVDEGTTLIFTNLATDADLPAQTLTYSMDPGTPTGATLDRFTGVFRWTPSEVQGGAVYNFTIRVSDNGSPTFSDSKSFTVTVNKVNSAPNVPPIANRTMPEETTVSFTISASDSDLPTQSLSFSLDPGAPAGASIDPVSGLFTWSPTEAQGPSTNIIVVRATDDGRPSMSTTQSFTIVVNEVNVAPVLTNLNNTIWTMNELTSITLTNRATDADIPTNILTYEIISAPAGATVNSASGLFNWTPTEAQGPSSNN